MLTFARNAAPPIAGLLFAAFVACVLAPSAGAVTLLASASGSLVPRLDTTPAVVGNGDFSIFRIGSDGSVVGDGIDEHTFWIHDFRDDPGLGFFSVATPLVAAVLRLTLTPAASPVADRAAIFGLREFRSPLFDAVRVGETGSITLDLREIYSDGQILRVLLGTSNVPDPRIPASGAGQLTLGYANDAVVSFAQLEITAAVPEPGAGALFGAGLLAIAVARRCASARRVWSSKARRWGC